LMVSLMAKASLLRLLAARAFAGVGALVAERALQARDSLVAFAERREAEALLDQLGDRGRVVRDMIDAGALELPCDQHRRNARAGAPFVMRALRVLAIGRGRNVIPGAAVLVIGHDDQRVGGVPALQHRLHELDEMAVALVLARIARMLVVRTQWLHEVHGRQTAGSRRFENLLFIAETLAALLL